MLQVFGLGVLVTGEAGAGKSALALELISRGHALVADDVVELLRPVAGVVLARCPPALLGYLETRGVGVVNIRKLHGSRAVRASERLDLVIRLVRRAGARAIAGTRRTMRVLGMPVPVLSLPTRTGDNLAARIEAACREHWLRLGGFRSDAAFVERQRRAMRGQVNR